MNVTGSLALGLLAGAAPAVVTAVGAGAVGHLHDLLHLRGRGHDARPSDARPWLCVYVVSSVVGCTAAAWLGLVVAG